MANIVKIKDFFDKLNSLNLVTEYDLMGRENDIIENVTFDSRAVTKNTLFVCKGISFKAEYLADSVKSGATFYISQQKYDVPNIPFIIVSDIRVAMAYIGGVFYDECWKALNMTAVTGTKGKSTTCYYLRAIIDNYMASLNKMPCGIASTIDIYDGVESKESHNTTPEALDLHFHLNRAVNSGITYFISEASSQAFKYHRLLNLRFNVGVFLNISEDHISPIEHPDFEDYFASKRIMFEQTDTACINMDCEHYDEVYNGALASKNIVKFSAKNPEADVYGYNIKKENDRIYFNVKTKDFDELFYITVQGPAMYNVENALAAIAAARVYNIPVEIIKEGLEHAASAGRMDVFKSNDGLITVIVDYAHNKLSFEKLYEAVNMDYPDYDIYTVFGCPGSKAITRRKDLGLLAGQHSNRVYLCVEDPNFEKFEDICDEIAAYIDENKCPIKVIEDRGLALKEAISDATRKTVILVTGKGNETRNKYGTEYIDCPSDLENAERYVAEYNMVH